MMDKYSVGKEDPVEKEASGLVKEGSCKNQSDAREEVVLKKDNRKIEKR